HPDHDWYRNPPLRFEGALFASGIGHLGAFMADFVPFEACGWLPLATIAALALATGLLRQVGASIALTIAGAICFLALGLTRVHDANPSVFFSGARMFLAVPVLIAMGAVWIGRGLERTSIPERFGCGGFLLVLA